MPDEPIVAHLPKCFRIPKIYAATPVFLADLMCFVVDALDIAKSLLSDSVAFLSLFFTYIYSKIGDCRCSNPKTAWLRNLKNSMESVPLISMFFETIG